MKLGLLADIHENIDALQSALDRLTAEDVDQIVVLGDIFRDGTHLDKTCDMLSDAGAVGVWGNHDYGLVDDPHPILRDRFEPRTLKYMGRLFPHLEIDGCYFSHNEPWLNPNEVGDLWFSDGCPSTDARIQSIFAAVDSRCMFAGHMHRWLLATPDGMQPWGGEEAIELPTPRAYVVLGACCEGSFALFDTSENALTPFIIR